MQAASRVALATATKGLDERIEGASVASLRTLAGELFDVAAVLVRERTLRRLLADPATPESERARLADTVFGGKVADLTMQTLTGLVSARWSQAGGLVQGGDAL